MVVVTLWIQESVIFNYKTIIMDHIFFDKDQNFYKIPEHFQVAEGDTSLKALTGEKTIAVNGEAVLVFRCTVEEMRLFLHQQWQNSVQQAKNDWMMLHQFNQLHPAGNHAGLKDNLTQLKTWLSTDSQSDTPEELDEEMLQQEIDALLPTALQAAPNVLHFFQGDQLNQAIADPEAWAEALYQSVYGTTEQQEAAQSAAELRLSVRKIIADNLP
jgi:hypothetical protein